MLQDSTKLRRISGNGSNTCVRWPIVMVMVS